MRNILLHLALFTTITSFAQSQSDTLDISTDVPDTMTVCGDSAKFTVTIKNTSAALVTDLLLNPMMPEGMIYVPGSVTGMTEFDISDPNEPLFDAASLAAGDSIVVMFFARADCDIIPLLTDPGSGNPVNNNTRVDFEIGGTPYFSLETGGSLSYNIIFADLFIPSVTPGNVKANIGDTIYRTIRITNGGLGSLDSFQLKIAHEPEVRFITASVSNPQLSLSFSTANDTTCISITGPGNFLATDTTVEIIECVVMDTCGSGGSEYIAQWGCNDKICNEGDFNAISNANVSISSGIPALTWSREVLDMPNFCSDTVGMIRLTYYNTGTETDPGGGRAMDIILRIASGFSFEFPYSRLENFSINGMNVDPLVTLMPNDGLGTNSYYVDLGGNTIDLDGPGNLSDLDNDGFYDDLEVGDSIVIDFDIILRCDTSFAVCPTSFGHTYLAVNSIFNNQCRQEFALLPRPDIVFQNFPEGHSSFGPTDMVDNQISQFIFCQFRRVVKFSTDDLLSCSADSVAMVIDVPPGLALPTNPDTVCFVPNKFPFDTIKLEATQVGNQVVIDTGILEGGCYLLDLQLDCSNQTGGALTVSWEMDYYCEDNCDCVMRLGCDSLDVFAHCPGPCPIATDTFEVERTTFGWTDETRTTRVNRNTPGVRLNGGWAWDTIQAYVPGRILSGGPYNNLHVLIKYTVIGSDNLIPFLDGRFEIFPSGGGGPIVCPITPADVTITTSGSPTTYFLDFLVPGACVGTFNNGDAIDLYANFVIKDSPEMTPGFFELGQFRAEYFIITPDSSIFCESWGNRFNILEPFTRHAFTNKVGSCDTLSTRYQTVTRGGFSGIGQEDFPNEFRHHIKWLPTLEISIPSNYQYIPGSSVYNFHNGTSQTIVTFPTIPDPVQVPCHPDTTCLIWTHDWPVSDEHISSSQIFEFDIVPKTCLALDGPNVFLHEVKWGWRVNDYTTDTVCTYDSITSFQRYGIFKRKPSLDIDPGNAIQDGFKRTTEWIVTKCNFPDSTEGIGAAFNTWLAFEPQVPNITITDVQDANTGVSIPFSTYGPGNRFVMADVGLIAINACRDIKVLAEYTDCIENELDTIDVYCGWACQGIPVERDSALCEELFTQLIIRYKTANLEMVVVNPDTNVFELCDTIPYEILLASTSPGCMYDVEFFMGIPDGMDLDNASAFYEYPLGDPLIPLPPAVNTFPGGFTGWDISEIVFTDAGVDTGLVGALDSSRNKIKLYFNLIPGCDFTSGNRIQFLSTGVTNCQDTIRIDTFFSEPIVISNLPDPDSLVISLSHEVLDCDSDQVLKVRIDNEGMAPTGNSGSIHVLIPPVSVYANAFVDIHNGPDNNTFSQIGNEVSWDLPGGVNSGDSIVFTFNYALPDSFCDDIFIHAFIDLLDTIPCADTICIIDTMSTIVQIIDSLCCDTCAEPATCEVQILTGNLPLCEGDSVVMFVESMNGQVIDSTDWFSCDGTIFFGTGDTIVVDTCGCFMAIIYDTCRMTQDTCAVSFFCNFIEVELPDTLLCDEDTVKLDAGPGFDSYDWSTGATTQMVTVLVQSDTNVWVTVTLDNCEASDTAHIRLDSLEVEIFASDTCVDDSGSVTLGANVTGGIPLFTFIWNLPDGSNLFTQFINATEPGLYVVTVFDSLGCVDRDSIRIDTCCPPMGRGEIQIAGSLPLCPGDTAVLWVEPITPLPLDSIVWVDCFNRDSIIGTGDTLYTDTCGCFMAVVIDTPSLCTDSCLALSFGCAPGVDVILPDTIDLCFDEDTIIATTSTSSDDDDHEEIAAIILCPKVVPGTPPYQYLWSTGSTDSCITVDSVGRYTVKVTDDNGCMDTATTVAIISELKVALVADRQIACFNPPDLINYTAITGIGTYQYEWFQVNHIGLRIPLGITTTPFFSTLALPPWSNTPGGRPPFVLTVEVKVTDLVTGCMGTARVDVFVNQCFFNGMFQVSNPVKEKMEIYYVLPETKDARMVVYNILGESVYDQPLDLEGNYLNISTAKLAKGVYVCSLVIDGNQVEFRKVTVLK